MTNPAQVIEWQAEALFTHNNAGRILRTNEPDSRRASWFFLGRTVTRNVWRLRDDVPDDLAQRLAAVAAREPVDPALPAEPHLASEIVWLLGETALVQSAVSGPAFRFPDRIDEFGAVIALDRSTITVLERFPWLPAELEDRRPCFAVVHDGQAVSVCFSSRRSDRVAEAGVDTLPDFRGNGYATAVTAAWARAVRAEGLMPLYSTSWDNDASRGVARRLGLIQYGVDWNVI